jgi:replicative DNA helicase
MPETVLSDRATETLTAALKVPPHSIEAEQSVLGGLMLENRAWDEIADEVDEDDFYRREHRLIFSAIRALADRNDPFDVVTASEWLSSHGELDSVGGMPHLAEIARHTPSAANIKAYAKIVRERSLLRRLIAVGSRIADSGFSTEGESAAELVDQAEQLVYSIAQSSGERLQGSVDIKDLLGPVAARIQELHGLDSHITGVATGFTKLDEQTSGLQKGDLVIVAGRPSMGKTAFAMNVVEYAAISGGTAVAVFSMEMPAEQLTMRLLSSLGRIDQHKVRTGKLSDDDWPRLTSALNILGETRIFIDDSPALTPTDLRARCRRLDSQHDLGLVVVDYLQLMQVAGSKENRATEISEISRSLKALAKELAVPVIALSQLNRSLEQRPDKRPVMSDLRESGAIEQDADVILFIYRDEVYKEDSPDKGIAEINIGKQRNGPIGKVKLTFLGPITKFENFAPDQMANGFYD